VTDVAGRAAATPAVDGTRRLRSRLLLPIAWRNLWRNRRRTYLTAGGIAFAVALLAFALSMQLGTYATMIDNATSLLSGHLQIQRAGYREDPRLETTIEGSSDLRARLERTTGVRAASERVEAFVLASAGERSFGSLMIGVDPARERRVSSLARHVVAGRYLTDREVIAGKPAPTAPEPASMAREPASIDSRDVEVFAGATLAKNLGLAVGGEIVLLGTDKNGGVAAVSGRLVGTFETGEAELDRALVELPLDAARAAFALGDEAHAIVVRSDALDLDALTAQVRAETRPSEVVLDWRTLLPDVQQAITLDRATGQILFGMLALLVTFGVLSTFVMLVFERTREFGVLLAIGMKPWRIVGMLELEACWLALIGIALGIAIAVPLVVWASHVGVGMGGDAQLLERFYMADRLYPALSGRSILEPSVILATATLVAAFLPSVRVRNLTPVGAMRDN